ncbi:MAG: glycoside hydrolase family 28 protein [Lachnospiraceae bacterium]|nr:glycoside hydrolase family 28 protein [Lachnospiraceae bacterium]
MIYDIRDYGAVGNGISNDTAAIQAAIDECALNGGGLVLLTGQCIYRSGAFVLRSNVEFHIEEGTVLKAGDRIDDFDLTGGADLSGSAVNIPTYENCDYDGCPNLFFIYAKDADNIKISGKGTIDGNEELFYGKISPHHIDGSFYPRVPLIFFENTGNLSVSDVTLRKSAFWTLHMVGCRSVTISNINILNNRLLANCDGIDPDHCRDVMITGCKIRSADDCIVFKNTSYGGAYGFCENITVEDCDLSSTSSAIKIGTESEDTFRNITVNNCRITDSNRGISLQLRDKGNIENVRFENIRIDTHFVSKEHWWGDAEPIAVTAVKRRPGTKIGHIKNVTFRDIKCSSENGILIYGDEPSNISGVTFSNVSLNIKKGSGKIREERDLRPCEATPFITAPPSALCIINAKSTDISGLRIFIDESKRNIFQSVREAVRESIGGQSSD